MTSLAEEHGEQRRWCLKPGFAEFKGFDQLLANEFIPPAEIRRRQNHALRRLLLFSVNEVAYYEQLFEKLKLTREDCSSIDQLCRLPVLSRYDLIENEKLLRAKRLPRGQNIYGTVRSSGTTGRRTRVTITHDSNFMYTLLLQRRYRWDRFNPLCKFAEIRAPHMLPPLPDGTPCQADTILERKAWRYVGTCYETGDYIGFTLAQPMERWLSILEEYDPAYLCTYSGVLEEIAFACVDRPPCEGLDAVLSLASQLTPQMRQRIEQTFHVPCFEGYGLNEIGLVAIRCEANRFHIHPEQCIVEIVDDDGQPCQPGQTGRIVITALQNLAMPLFRYDTDDTAKWSDGPCPCGRTLPSFTDLWGRMRRYAVLPPETRHQFNVLSEALENAPPELLRNLRRYQIHQYRDGRFELRIVSTSPMQDEFYRHINDAWETGLGEDAVQLDTISVDDIPLQPSGKRLDFTSDYFDDVN